jgi:hypothetical protein
MPRARLGDYHIGISTPGCNPSFDEILEHQQSAIRDLIKDWGGQQSAFIEPEGEFRVTHDIWVMPSTLQECLQLPHKTKFIVLHGIMQEQVCNHNNGSLWIQETYKLNTTVLREHRAARLEEERLAKEDPTTQRTSSKIYFTARKSQRESPSTGSRHSQRKETTSVMTSSLQF